MPPRRTPARRSTKTYLFSYGSNSPRQLAERLGHAVTGRAAFVDGYLRAFRGWSNRWEGGVATLIPGRGKTYGYIAEVTPADLAVLDRYEGVATGNYRRQSLTVTTNDGDVVEAIAYLASSTEKNAPSRAYKRAVAETISAFWEGSSGPVTEDDITVRNNPRQTNPAAKKDLVLYHGTLDQFVPSILREGLKPAPGWGGANTFGVFLSGSYDGAQNWGRYAAASNLDLDGDGESDFGGDAERYTRAFPSLPHVRVLRVTVPAAMAKNLRADMEQAEEHGFDGGPKDWRASLSIIGDVMYAGSIPAAWLSPASAPSASAALTPVQEARVREALYGLRYSEDASDVVRQAGARVREQLSARTPVSPNDVSALLSWYRAETKRNPAARTTRTNPDAPARVRLVGFDKQRALSPAVEAFIRDVFDASHPLPFQNAYRTQRVLANIEAVVEVFPEHGGIKIETVRALSRRKGEGTKAMRFLTDRADKHGVSLYLYAKPFGDEKMPLDDLVRFYRRFGFRQDEEADEEEDEYEGVEMHRWPREVWPQEAQRTNPRRRNPSQTDTPAFKAWFGTSKVVDHLGRPLRVYHGTHRGGFDTFGRGRRYAPGFFFSDDPKVAWTYARTEGEPVLRTKKDRRDYEPALYEVYLQIEKPLVVDANGEMWNGISVYNFPRDLREAVREAANDRYASVLSTDSIAAAARALGYDGLIVQNVVDDIGGEYGLDDSEYVSTIYVVFDAHQIKSANMNSGKYSLTDASILRNPPTS